MPQIIQVIGEASLFQGLLYFKDQLRAAKGLFDKAMGSPVDGLKGSMAFFRVGDDNDDAGFIPSLGLLEDLVSVDLGRSQLGEDEIVVVLFDLTYGLPCIEGHFHLIAGIDQGLYHLVAQSSILFNDQDVKHTEHPAEASSKRNPQRGTKKLFLLLKQQRYGLSITKM